MAQEEMTLTVRFRWWVRPSLWAVILLAMPLLLVADDDQIAGFSAALAVWFVKHGMKFEL